MLDASNLLLGNSNHTRLRRLCRRPQPPAVHFPHVAARRRSRCALTQRSWKN